MTNNSSLLQTKIKVLELLDDNANEETIDKFITDQGFTVDQIKNFKIDKKQGVSLFERFRMGLAPNEASEEKTMQKLYPESVKMGNNFAIYDDKTQELMKIENEVAVGQFDIRVIGNSTMPSNKWGEWNVYMEAFQAGLIDKVEALKKTEIFDKEGVMQRTDEVTQLQSQLQQAQQQIKKLNGDLQTAHRESVQSRKQVEVAKFQGKLKEQEYDSKTRNKASIDKLDSVVKLESEKLRLATEAEKKRSQTRKTEKSR